MHRESVKVCVWNVRGLRDKIGDEEWREYLKCFEIVCLLETWIKEEIDIPKLNEFENLIFVPAEKKNRDNERKIQWGSNNYDKGGN